MALTELPEKPDDPATTPEPATLSRPLRLRRFAGLLILAAIFAGSAALSWRYPSIFLKKPEPAEVPQIQAKDANKKKEEGSGPAAILARGDQSLLNHRYADALANYEELRNTGSIGIAIFDYRLGLCNELLGQTTWAVASYRKAIDGASTPLLKFAGHLAMARCLLRQNQPAEARQLLYPFLFDETRLEGMPPIFVSDARYLTALTLTREATPKNSPGLNHNEFVPFSMTALETPFYFDEIAVAGTARPSADANTKSVPLLVQKSSAKQSAILLQIQRTEQPAWKLLDQLALEGGLRPEWTPDAKRSLEDRSLHLHLRNRALQDVLEDVADSFDLICIVDVNTTRFSTRAEADTKRERAFLHQVAQRALRQALLADTSHAWAPAALLELGNRAAADAQWKEAASWYNRVSRDVPSSGVVPAAYFNLGQIYLRTQEYAKARQALFRAIDQAPGHELALRAYLRIGQLYLDEDNARDAVLHLRRAQTMVPHSPYHPAVTLTLAAVALYGSLCRTLRYSASVFRVLSSSP